MAKIQGSGILNGVRIDAASVPWVDPITDVMDQFSKYKSEWVGWRENKNLTVRMPHDLHDQLSDLQTLVVTGVLVPKSSSRQQRNSRGAASARPTQLTTAT